MTELKTLAKEYSNSSIPLIYGLDSVHGANYVYGAAIFPHVRPSFLGHGAQSLTRKRI